MKDFDLTWTFGSIAKRAREILQQEGVKAFAYRVLGELGYRRAVLFELDLAQYRLDDVSPPSNVRFELLSADKVGDLLGLVRHCDEREARRRIEEGHLCTLGYVDDKPAYSGWLAPGRVRIAYLDMAVVPGPATAYSYEVYVDSSARGLGLAKLGMHSRVRILRERGFRKCVSTVVPENRAGIAHTRASGFQVIGRAYCLRIGRFKRSWIRTSREAVLLQIVER